MVEEFRPKSWDSGAGGEGGGTKVGAAGVPPDGVYIWALRVTGATFCDTEKDKPYALVGVVIESTAERPTPYKNFPFSFRLYLNKAAEGWAKWFLRKFGYPDELLEQDPPLLRRKAMIGLVGEAKIAVEANLAKGWVNFDAKGWQRRGEDQLNTDADGEPSRDIREDVKSAPADPLAGLDDEETPNPEVPKW